MFHTISFISQTQSHYSISIDGTVIEFSRAMNKIPYGDCDAFATYVDNIEQCLLNGQPFSQLKRQMNGVNMLRLLASIFREQTVQAWMNFVVKNISLPTKDAFVAYFGFKHNKKVFPSEFGSELFEMSLQYHKAAEAKAKADAEEERRICKRNRTLLNIVSEIEKTQSVSFYWVVEKRSVSGNVVSYIINGHDFSFCLSDHSLLNSAKTVAEILISLEEAFNSKNRSAIKHIIKSIGGKAAFQIMSGFFCDQAKRFFQSDFSEHVISERIKPTTNVYMKAYFGGSCGLRDPFYLELLGMLEENIPSLEQRLVETSAAEMSSKHDEWRIFYYKRSVLSMCSIRFPDINPLGEEIRQYLLHIYNQLSYLENDSAPILFEINRSIRNIINAVDRPISSVLELSVWDYRNAIVSMSKTVKTATIRSDIFHMRGFIAYLDPDIVEKAIPLSIIPSREINPNQPLSTSVILKIAEYHSELSTCVWLAFQMFALTGSRAGSMFNLTVDDLVEIDGTWIVRIYYGKAAARKAKSNTPSFVTHRLPNEFAQELLRYIDETSLLRESFSPKYVFVYTSSTFRQQSLRKPKVLTSHAFCTEIKKLCTKYGIYNDDGSVPNPTAQGIRAEVGRALFAKGASPETVAGKLGNTAYVAKRHYDSMYPADEAAMRRDLYSKTVDAAIDSSEAEEYPFAKNDPMYGSCKSSDICRHGNDCRTCSERIQKRQKEV